MKMKRLWASILAGAMLFSLAACGGNGSGGDSGNAGGGDAAGGSSDAAGGSADGEQLEFYLVDPYVGYPYWEDIWVGVEAACKEYGVLCNRVGPTEVNVDEQLKFMETAIASKCDGIFTSAITPESFQEIINRAMAQGIPVVTIDADAPDSDRIVYAGTSNYDAGYKAGETMIEATGGQAKIGIITGTIDQQSLIDRYTGFQDAIKDEPGMEVLTMEASDNQLTKATEKAQSMLTTYPEMNAIFGTTGSDAIGASVVAKERNMSAEDLTIIGFDDLEDTLNNIRDGYIYATMVQNTYEMGWQGIELLYKINKGEYTDKKIPGEDIIDTGVTVVTKDNLDTYKADMAS